MATATLIYEQFETFDDDWVIINDANKIAPLHVAPTAQLSFLQVLLKPVVNTDKNIGNSEALPKRLSGEQIFQQNKTKKDVSRYGNIKSDSDINSIDFTEEYYYSKETRESSRVHSLSILPLKSREKKEKRIAAKALNKSK